jgi:hypothetical protein
MQNIAIFDDITFALSPHFTRFFGGLFAPQRDKIIIGNGFRADKSTFKITMNDTRGLWGQRPSTDCPGPGFLRSDREIGFQLQKLISCANKPIQARFLQSHF